MVRACATQPSGRVKPRHAREEDRCPCDHAASTPRQLGTPSSLTAEVARISVECDHANETRCNVPVCDVITRSAPRLATATRTALSMSLLHPPSGRPQRTHDIAACAARTPVSRSARSVSLCNRRMVSEAKRAPSRTSRAAPAIQSFSTRYTRHRRNHAPGQEGRNTTCPVQGQEDRTWRWSRCWSRQAPGCPSPGPADRGNCPRSGYPAAYCVPGC